LNLSTLSGGGASAKSCALVKVSKATKVVRTTTLRLDFFTTTSARE
jgi:hypothetical protein